MRKQLSILLTIVVLSLALVSSVFAMEYKEAPQLAELVAAGVLPPVEERLPLEPMVIEPVSEIGVYGGSLTMGSASVNQWSTTSQLAIEYLLTLDQRGEETIPNIAKDWEFSEDGRELIIYLREGMKWSDGHPFTAEDFVFWYEDVLLNKELTPTYPIEFVVGGKLMELEVIDDYTLVYKFAQPYWGFIHQLNGTMFVGGQNYIFLPKHYLSQWHINYNPDANKLAQEAGYDEWWELFERKREFGPFKQAPGLPSVGAWIIREETPSGLVYDRNPYYFKVDTAGNQLPYLDHIRGLFYAGSFETNVMRIIAGDIDFEPHGTSINDYPLFKNNEAQGDYYAYMGPDTWTSVVTYFFNQNYRGEDEYLGDLLRNKKFRQALSLAIDREEINETALLGQGIPQQATFHYSVPAFKDEWARAYADYDVARAQELLAELGLTEKSRDGWLLRPDGQELSVDLLVGDYFGQFIPVTELVTEYWQDLGIKVNMRVMDRAYITTTMNAAEHEIVVYLTDVLTESATNVGRGLRVNPAGMIETGPLYLQWYNSDGQEGVEPPAIVQEVRDLLHRLPHAPPEEQYAIFERVGDIYAEELWGIGTVGLVGKPIIVKNGLRNVNPESGADDAAWGGVRVHWMEQFYWENPEQRTN